MARRFRTIGAVHSIAPEVARLQLLRARCREFVLGTAPTLMFLAIEGAPTHPNAIHLDLHTTDRQSEVERAIRLGANRVRDVAEYGIEWTPLTDPVANLFDIASE
jgi:hypothetical protein